MGDKEFEKILQCAKSEIQRLREEGCEDRFIRCWLIGYLTSDAGMSNESTYTSSQLKRLFDLTFSGGRKSEECIASA